MFLTGVVFCLWPGLLLADERGPITGTPAERVIKAFDTKATKVITRIAAEIYPDRWSIADEVCIQARQDAAAAFAEAVPGVEGPKLGAYLRARGKAEPHAPTRAALLQAEQATTSEQHEAALVSLQKLGAAGDAYEQARVQLAWGFALRALGRHAEVRRVMAAVAVRAEELGWLTGAVRAWMRVGHAAWAAYDAAGTLAGFEKLRAAEALRDAIDGQVSALNNLGAVQGMVGNFRGAKRDFKRAFELVKDATHPRLVDQRRRVRLNMAEMAVRAGRFARAGELLDQAMDDLPAEKNSMARADALAQRSNHALSMHDPHRAARDADAAEKIYGGLHEKARKHDPAGAEDIAYLLAKLQANRGIILHDLGESEDAIAALKAAQATFAEMNAVEDEAGALDNLGWILGRLGRQEESLAALHAALALAQGSKDRWRKTNVRQNIAQVLIDQGKAEEAQDLLIKSLADAKIMAAPKLVADGYRGLARAWLKLGEPRKAAGSAREASVALLDSLQGLASAQGPYARTDNAAVFEMGIEAAVALQDVDEAWLFIERSRAVLLLQSLQGREEARDDLVPARLLADERAIEVEIAEARALMDRAWTKGDRTAYQRLKSRLEAAWAEKSMLASRILRKARASATVLLGTVNLIPELQARLSPGDVFVSYAFTGQGVVAVVVDAKASRLEDLGTAAKLDRALGAVTWDEATIAVDDKGRKALADLLLGKLKIGKDAKRVIISPVGSLASFPFSALLPNKQVVLAPSGTVYTELGTDAGLRGKGVLGIGAADYAGRPKSLVPLDSSRGEIEAVATRRLMGKEANEIAFRAALAESPRWRAVHFAVHGTSDPEHPLRGSLAFTRSEDEADDGFLTALEVLRMKVPADVAVLSACVTGKGRYFKLEGLVGLGRSFMIAGVPRVIGSLWNVSDDATLALMRRFHELWNPKDPKIKPLSAAEALSKAQAFVRSKPKWKHEYYWAGWVLWGVPS